MALYDQLPVYKASYDLLVAIPKCLLLELRLCIGWLHQAGAEKEAREMEVS